jgi:hypothetical protein
MFSVALSVERISIRPPGRYPAHRSVEFGLSSPALDEAGRPSGPAAYSFIIFDPVERQRAITHVTIPSSKKYAKIIICWNSHIQIP